MKLLLVSDLHLMGRTPVSRKDNFMVAQFNKVKQIINIASEHDKYVLQAGDFFDSYSPSYRLLNTYIRLLDTTFWYVILGQHDLYLWDLKSINRTALSILESSNCVQILRQASDIDYGVRVYGCSWGQEIPEPDMSKDCNILIIHKNIGDKPLFPEHTLIKPKRFLNKHKFDLILCGDYHFPFEYSIGDRLIINPGTISRVSITERDVKPSVVVYDTETRKYEWITLDYEEDVFTEREETSKVLLSNEKLTHFLTELKTTNNLTISFSDNVNKALEEVELSSKVRNRVTQVVNECKGGME